MGLPLHCPVCLGWGKREVRIKRGGEAAWGKGERRRRGGERREKGGRREREGEERQEGGSREGRGRRSEKEKRKKRGIFSSLFIRSICLVTST